MRNMWIMRSKAEQKFPMRSRIQVDSYLCEVVGYLSIFVPPHPTRDGWQETVAVVIKGHPFMEAFNFELP